MEAANNKSDEEMEDVIKELRHTAIMLSCNKQSVWYTKDGDVDETRNKFYDVSVFNLYAE